LPDAVAGNATAVGPHACHQQADGGGETVSTLVAVYPDRPTAEAVATELQQGRGIPEDSVRVGERADALTSIGAEMGAEVDASWASGALGLVTSDMLRGALLVGSIGVAIGVVLGAPVGVLLYDPSVSVLTRLLIGAFVGSLFGSVVGALIGGGMAMKSPDEQLAAERGVPVAVADVPEDDADLEALLASYDPIRVDRFVDGQRVATPTTEGPSGVTETVAELVANSEDPARR